MYSENNVSSVSIFTFFSVTLCMVFGVTGNVMVLCYYTLFVRKGFLRVLAIAMATFDLLSCLVLMPLQMYLTLLTYMIRTPSDETCQAFWGLQMFVVCACAWLLASWTYEMQRKIFTSSQTTIDQRRVALEVAGAVAVAVTASVPAVLISGVTSHVEYLQKPRLVAVCFVAQRFLGRPWVLVYHGTIAIYLIGVTCFIITTNMRMSSAVFRVSNSSSSLDFTASKDSLSLTDRPPPPPPPPPISHSSIQMPPSKEEFNPLERNVSPEATTHPEPLSPVKFPSQLEPNLGKPVSAAKVASSLLSLPPSLPSKEETKQTSERSRCPDSSVPTSDLYQRDQSR